MFIWKWWYYAPNTYKIYCLNRLKSTDIKKYNSLSKHMLTTPYTPIGYITTMNPG